MEGLVACLFSILSVAWLMDGWDFFRFSDRDGFEVRREGTPIISGLPQFSLV
jgi:hypothetical protein